MKHLFCQLAWTFFLVGAVVATSAPRSFAQEEGAAAADAAEAPAEEAITTPPLDAGGAEADAPPTPIDTGNNAWMLTSTALVLFMTTPGLAMFYGGLVRKKNIVSVLMQCLALQGVMSVLWAVIGYSLAFGGDGKWLGDMAHVCMEGLQSTYGSSGNVYPMHTGMKTPLFTHMLFQGMFFIITPGLICGAFAERMKFSAMIVFSILWGLIVYCPLCHWVWDGGILAYGAKHAEGIYQGGALDFAGGTVVHISSGVSALVCALVLGKRIGYPTEPMPPHNLAFTALGAGMLWVGWFGFNAGSALAADGIAASAFAATHFAAAAGAVAWPAMEWLMRGKPTLLGAASGAVAGLVCITPAAGFVLPMWGMVMGAIAGLFCCFACAVLKPKFGYDDSLDAFGVHGLGGTLGAVLTGVFATRAVWDIGAGKTLGLIEGGNVIAAQIVATVITWVFAAVASFILLKVIDATIGLRVTPDEEQEGLDVTQHGEEGYIF